MNAASISTTQLSRLAMPENAFANAVAAAKNNPTMVKVAKEFEETFLGQMLQPMFTGVDAAEPFGGGHAEQTYRPMLINEYAKGLSGQGGIGIADAVLREMVKIQMAQGQIAGLAPNGAPIAPTTSK